MFLGEELRNNVRYTIGHNSTNLRIANVLLSDAGRYECEASNTIATVSSYAVLTVREQGRSTIISHSSRKRCFDLSLSFIKHAVYCEFF